MDELSSARATAPRPIGATAKLASSSGESADTNVSIAYTRRGFVPSDAAAASAPSSPISSRTLQMKITWCLSVARSRRRSASSCAVEPTRSSNDRPVARVPASRTYCLGIVTVPPGPMPRAMVAARDVVPTSTRNGGGVWRWTPEARGKEIGRGAGGGRGEESGGGGSFKKKKKKKEGREREADKRQLKMGTVRQ